MAGFLIELKDHVEALKTEGMTGMEAIQTEGWMRRYKSIIEEGIKEDDEKSPKVFSKKTSKLQRSKALNLLLKLQKYDLKR